MSQNSHSAPGAAAACKSAEVERQTPGTAALSSTSGTSLNGAKKQSPCPEIPGPHASSASVASVSPHPDESSSQKRALPDPSANEETSTKKAKALTVMAQNTEEVPSASDLRGDKANSDSKQDKDFSTAANAEHNEATSSAPVDHNSMASSPTTDLRIDNESPTAPAVAIDKKNWQGFCEIESDPAAFSVILREMGVKDIAVREVLSMDPATLETIPQPIYGFIFLFRYREFGNENQVAAGAGEVWFCNQLPAQNSCGTLAMLNIIMNNPVIELGEHLTQFREFTQDMSSAQRGEALASFNFVKQIHNSFAKRMDMLENDKHLAAKAKRSQAEKKPKKAGGRRDSEDSAGSDQSTESRENGHHFIAFVPVGSNVWKLDGMDAQPTSIGSFDAAAGETWISYASDTINTLMTAGDSDYGVLAVCQSPLSSLRIKAALTISELRLVESRLRELDQTWDDCEALDVALDMEQQFLSAHPVPASIVALIAAEDCAGLAARRSALMEELRGITANMAVEVEEEAAEQQKAEMRRFDAGPVLKVWLEMLAENGYLAENLGRFMP